MDPPPCVQNAMMTKDKKPFTYTPGGINLSEVRSPRMARRIEQNAHLEGAGDIPKPRPPHTQSYESLPPSTLAAMRPQPQVQVFPTGPPPPGPMRGGNLPPPPPPSNTAPPPPPPPTGPLPTQKVKAGDQVLERPDMTRIIPENPMALLRKTGGPQPRNTLVDEMFSQGGRNAPGPRSPPTPPQKSPSSEPQNGYQPSFNGRGAPISPVPQPQQKYQPPSQIEQQAAQPHQRDFSQYQPVSPQCQPHPQHSQFRPQPQQQSLPEIKNEPSKYQPPVIERQVMKPRQDDAQPEIKTSTAHLGSLYIPPADQQQQQRRVVSPPSPPVRNQNQDSPNIQSPSLKESPKPWQTKKNQQEEIPPWAKKDNQEVGTSSSPPVTKQQQRQPESAQQIPAVHQQQPVGVRIEIRTNPVSPYPNMEERSPNAVYVTQPLVFQDPGRRAPPQHKVDSQGARIIPIRVEGTSQDSRTPQTPNNERSFSRQQSFGSNPTQSHSFKIIQKLTNTDDDVDDEYTPITKHSPRYPQNFQQPEHRGGMKMSEQNMANTFKQVPHGSQQTNDKGPQVRTIPIQIEGDYKPQEYVHPSEQTVPEPKKYTGSSIPSRSFKILQAMTAPDNCASVNDQNEALPYDEGSYYPQYPPPPFQPFWPNYFPNSHHPSYHSELSEDDTSKNKSTLNTPIHVSTPGPAQRQIPVPFWGYFPLSHYPTTHKKPSTSAESDSDASSDPRTTPVPFWPYGYPVERGNDIKAEEFETIPQYPPYFDPYYYYYYYYGYMPMYAPYPHYQMNDEGVHYTEYSTAESELTSDENKTDPKIIRDNNSAESAHSDKNNELKERRVQMTDSESDSESYELPIHKSSSCLKSARSVKDINIYNVQEDDSDDEDGSEDSDEENSSCILEGDTLPHELSVILEESEGRTESRLRTISVMSDSTTIADLSDNENEDNTRQVRIPLKLCICVGEEHGKNVIVENGNLKTFGDTEIYASYTLKSNSVTPREQSPCKDFREEDQLIKQNNNEENLNEKSEEKSNETFEELDDGKESDESEDWWGILGKEDDEPKPRRPLCDVSTDEAKEWNDSGSSSNLLEEDNDQNNYASAICSSRVENISRIEEKAKSYTSDDNEIKEKSNEFSNSSDEIIESNNHEEIFSVSISESYKNISEKDNISRIISSEKNSETSSIYKNVEDFEVDTNGKLMEMENFVAQLEKIQECSGLWNTSSSMESQQKQLQKEIIDDAIIESDKNYVRDKKTNGFKIAANTNIGTNIIEIKNSLEHDEKTISAFESTRECSTNYTEYNSCTSPQVFGDGKCTLETNKSMEIQYNKESDRHSVNQLDSDETSDESEYSSEEEENGNILLKNKSISDEEKVKIPSIKDRIQALKDSIKQKQERILQQKTEISVKERECVYTSARSRTKSISTKSSIKSFEELSEEEEIDSGVTSDMSRHISDTEEFSELKKLTRYQRAATHSRLFKLLQEQCENENSDEENETTNDNFKRHQDSNEQPRRDHLRLPLSKDFDSGKSLETNNISPVNERLVDELIQSFLKRKKAQVFKNIPPEKLFAAATKILQEEFEAYETPTSCSSFLSPLRGSTGYSTAVHTPQEFVNNHEEYQNYYESWSGAETAYDENYDILPSKAFKLLQEHSNYSKTGAIAGLLAKCPRVVSSKNVHKKLMKLLESSENSITVLDKPLPHTNEVTNAS